MGTTWLGRPAAAVQVGGQESVSCVVSRHLGSTGVDYVRCEGGKVEGVCFVTLQVMACWQPVSHHGIARNPPALRPLPMHRLCSYQTISNNYFYRSMANEGGVVWLSVRLRARHQP